MTEEIDPIDPINKIDKISRGLDPEVLKTMIIFGEQKFFTTSKLPLQVEWEQEFGVQETSNYLPDLIKYYKKSGILDQSLNGILDPKQFVCAQMLLNTADRRSIRTKLKEINVTVADYDRWRRLPAFQRYLEVETKRRFGDAHVTADLELVKNVEDGRLDAIKYYNELSGRYTTPEAVNVAKVFAVMMEILVKYVTGDVLNRIARDMEEQLTLSVGKQMNASKTIELELTLD